MQDIWITFRFDQASYRLGASKCNPSGSIYYNLLWNILIIHWVYYPQLISLCFLTPLSWIADALTQDSTRLSHQMPPDPGSSLIRFRPHYCPSTSSTEHRWERKDLVICRCCIWLDWRGNLGTHILCWGCSSGLPRTAQFHRNHDPLGILGRFHQDWPTSYHSLDATYNHHERLVYSNPYRSKNMMDVRRHSKVSWLVHP